jgi:ABC-type nitrate/sulfonate/bicarbonate transport system substrate-binding protein
LQLDPAADVFLTNLGSAQNILAALQAGAIDAGVLSSPTNLQAKALGMRELVNTARLNDPFPSAWAAASKKYIADHTEAMRRFVKSMVEAIAFEINNPELTQQVLTKYVKIDDPAVARASYEEVAPYLNRTLAPDPEAVRSALHEQSGVMPQAASADPATFIDARFTDELEASGFIKSLYS